MSNPHEWHIVTDREGFFIEDEYGEEVNPPFLTGTHAQWRCQSYAQAHQVLYETISDALDNQEPKDPPGFEGGFADNH